MNLYPQNIKRTSKKSPLHRHLLFSRLSVVLIGVTMLLVVLLSTYQLHTHVMYLTREDTPPTETSLRIIAGVQHSIASLRGWINHDDPLFIDHWRSAWDQEIQPAMTRLIQCRQSSRQHCSPARIEQLQSLLTRLQTAQQRIQRIQHIAHSPNNTPAQQRYPHHQSADWNSAVYEMRTLVAPLADKTITLAAHIADHAKKHMDQEVDAARNISTFTVNAVIATAFMMLAFVYITSRKRARPLTRPISTSAEETRHLADDHITHDLPTGDSTEIFKLTQSFNQMRASMLQAQTELRESNTLLEECFNKRTAQLAATNASLKQEIEFRNQTEKALRRSEARLRAMTRAIPDMVFVVDEDGLYREILAAGRNWDTTRIRPPYHQHTIQPLSKADHHEISIALLNDDPAKTSITPIRGKRLDEVHTPEMAKFFLDIIHRALASQKIQVAEYELTTASGQRWFESRTAPLDIPLSDPHLANSGHDDAQLQLFEPIDPQPTEKPAAIVVARDITKRKQAENQLRQAKKMQAIGELTGGIAHDFNNLLAVIMGNLELLDEQLSVHPRLHELAHQALRAVDRGTTLTRRLLVFARRQPLQPQPTDLNKLVLGTIDLIRRTLGARIRIETVLAPNLGQTQIDPDQFESALLNLVINARDAMPESGQLILETKNTVLDEDYAASHQDIQPGHYVVLSVSDSGNGMPPDILERVFEPFFTTKETGRGSGLGLSMVYGLMKQSGGNITLYSELGQGTTVRLYLPQTKAETHVSTTVETLNQGFQGHGETILVVEDDPDVRQFAVKALNGLGYRTLQSADAETALSLLTHKPQTALLFTDIVLPGPMDGVKLATEATRQRPELPVLFTSGYTEHMLLNNGKLADGVEMLPKPYRKIELAKKLRLLLQKELG
ncbi:MAG: hypothetical protein CSA09_04930 [Candidatus Contendobacter odensis]|uniref:histidine kinase n=1 Tax=Candidatus Contendibacter odensensis TaxID=1400860 RepID=A0A2G6PEC8_9GAMM|nr:MAG: hypothetical protein CSA09_04930 [Candidatus Contendobacter odensis]